MSGPLISVKILLYDGLRVRLLRWCCESSSDKLSSLSSGCWVFGSGLILHWKFGGICKMLNRLASRIVSYIYNVFMHVCVFVCVWESDCVYTFIHMYVFVSDCYALCYALALHCSWSYGWPSYWPAWSYRRRRCRPCASPMRRPAPAAVAAVVFRQRFVWHPSDWPPVSRIVPVKVK